MKSNIFKAQSRHERENNKSSNRGVINESLNIEIL